MEGYDVITSDDEQAGRAAGRAGTFLIVEQGAVFKHRRPVPEAFATVDDARVIRLTVSKAIVEDAPEVENGRFDERAVAEHYGLAAGVESPETLGHGEVTGSDPALSAERDEAEHRGLPTPEERARTQTGLGPGQGPHDSGPPSPGVTGGDRRRDAPPDTD
jgi:hypothetical protein